MDLGPLNTGSPKEGETILFTNCSFKNINSGGFTITPQWPYEMPCILCESRHLFMTPMEQYCCYTCRENNLPKYSLWIRLLKWLVR
jgi:hypothetical protein